MMQKFAQDRFIRRILERDTPIDRAPLPVRLIDALAPLPDGPVKKALTRFAEAIVERSH